LSERQWTNSRRCAALAAVMIAAALGAACTEVGTDPDAPVSLAFDTLPAPSVVVGDTMRDVNGTATPLAAFAFNADGDSISSAEIRFVYVPADTTAAARSAVTISDGFVIASASAPALPASTLTHRVVAQAGSLQSQPPRSFSIVARPDSAEAAASVATTDTVIKYGNPSDTTAVARMVVLHDSTAGAPSVPVPSYLVEFRIESGAPAVADSVLFVTGRRRSATLVTATSSSGIAEATVRAFVRPGVTTADSIVIRGYAHYGRDPSTGEPRPLRGSPVRMVVRLEPTAAAR